MSADNSVSYSWFAHNRGYAAGLLLTTYHGAGMLTTEYYIYSWSQSIMHMFC